MPIWLITNEDAYDDVRDPSDSDGGGPAAHDKTTAGRKAGSSGSYDSWTVPELRRRAKELGMTGYSSLSKSDLIFELRNR